MRVFLAIMFRCVLALGLGFVPVANAFDMLAMTQTSPSQEDAPPCHMPCHDQQNGNDKCHGGSGQGHCHCAMATALPVALPGMAHPIMPSDHPQTVRHLTLQQSVIPDTPPPRC